MGSTDRKRSDRIAARVLMVDDLGSNRMLVRQVLAQPDYEVIEASNGAEAIGILKVEPVDAVLMDVVMPEMDGVEACRRIRTELGLDLLPVIMLTVVDTTEDVVNAMQSGADDYVTKPFNPLELRARVRAAIERKRLTDRLDDTESVLFALARMVEARDENTGDHCDRLAHMGVVFGRDLGLSYDEIEALRRGGVLHDIGKLGIPDAVLLKNGKLDEREWSVMRRHTVIGAALCSPLRTMRRTGEIVLCHHEKWNGNGYPKGLAADAVPLLARVFQIVDVYDALSTERPYKPAFPVEKVIQIMERETGDGFWDPVLAERFMRLLRDRPADLKRPADHESDRSARIFIDIQQTREAE
ncbi:MAG TPA: response regulator [Alphaproteobacteria bacterium]|nr:response regulator [Alphaproteobacteria bacterium]